MTAKVLRDAKVICLEISIKFNVLDKWTISKKISVTSSTHLNVSVPGAEGLTNEI